MKSLHEATERMRDLTFEVGFATKRLHDLGKAAQEDPRHLPDARVAYHALGETYAALGAEAPALLEAIRAGLNLPPEGERDEDDQELEGSIGSQLHPIPDWYLRTEIARELEADQQREPEPASTVTDGELGEDLDASQDSAPERTERPATTLRASMWSRARLAHAQRESERYGREVLSAFGQGRSAELDPRNDRRDTLTSKAIAAGWGGR